MGSTDANPRETNCTPTFFFCKMVIKGMNGMTKSTELRYCIRIPTSLEIIHDRAFSWTAIGWNRTCSPLTIVCSHALLSPIILMLSILTGSREELRRGSRQIGKCSTFSNPDGSTSITLPCNTTCFLIKEEGTDCGVVNFLNWKKVLINMHLKNSKQLPQSKIIYLTGLTLLRAIASPTRAVEYMPYCKKK